MAQELRFDILGHRIRRQVCFDASKQKKKKNLARFLPLLSSKVETFWLVFLQGELAILEIYAENLLIYENIED